MSPHTRQQVANVVAFPLTILIMIIVMGMALVAEVLKRAGIVR